MPPANEGAGKESLATAADFIKYTTGFATGALIFSAGLLDKIQHLSSIASLLLILAWVLLSFSVLTGVFAFSRIPILQSEANYNLEDKFFIWPGRAHQIFFVVGILSLGAVLIAIMCTTHVGKREFKVNSALQAVEIAKQHIPEGLSIAVLKKVEIQSGVGDPEKASPVWLVSVSVQKEQSVKVLDSLKNGSIRSTRTCTKHCRHCCHCEKLREGTITTINTLNILIDAMTGQIISIP